MRELGPTSYLKLNELKDMDWGDDWEEPEGFRINLFRLEVIEVHLN